MARAEPGKNRLSRAPSGGWFRSMDRMCKLWSRFELARGTSGEHLERSRGCPRLHRTFHIGSIMFRSWCYRSSILLSESEIGIESTIDIELPTIWRSAPLQMPHVGAIGSRE
eukprot:6272779-Pyramimonas_sp.AAC.1